MFLVTRDEHTILLSPSTCLICEQSPQPGQVIVDTLRNFEQGARGPGRKYVCDSCIGELAATLGLSSGHGERVAKAENKAYAIAFETLRYRLREQAEELVKLVNEPLSNLREPIGAIETTVGTGQDSFEVERDIHVSRSAGIS